MSRTTYIQAGASIALAVLMLLGLVTDLTLLETAAPGVGLAMAGTFAPFPIDPELQAVSIAYRNDRLIADDVLPRQPVGKQEYIYYEWNKEESYTVPDTSVGRTSAPNQVEFQAEEKTSSTSDYALDDPLPLRDIENAPDTVDPEARATEGLTDLILLDREVRVASLVFDPAQYAASNKITLSGTDQFSDFSNSDPIGVIEQYLNVPLVRPNVMTLGQEAWSKLRQHPDIIKAVNATAGDTGLAQRDAVAELFELEEIQVGSAFLNTSTKGQNASFSRVWGKHILLHFKDELANPSRSASRVTFGWTAQFGDRIAGSIEDNDIGMRGGQRVRVGESVDEHIVAPDVASFIEDAVA